MDFITELHNQVDILERDGDSTDEITERVAIALNDLGYALATPRLIKDNVKFYLKSKDSWDNYNPIDYIT
jgi:hypothetical protein|tara:strand:+ start:272 stop:481 length:210 start_codon:yes stop_codon:yes gene_type:complete